MAHVLLRLAAWLRTLQASSGVGFLSEEEQEPVDKKNDGPGGSVPETPAKVLATRLLAEFDRREAGV